MMKVRNIVIASVVAIAIVSSSDTVKAQNSPVIKSRGSFLVIDEADMQQPIFDAEDITNLDRRVDSLKTKIEKIKQDL